MNLEQIEVNEKVFKGVWIPVEIWNDHRLSWMEKCLWAEISFLGTKEKPCFASNAYLAKMFNSTESSISNMISKMRSFEMIKQVSYDGRCRKILAVLPKETSPTDEVRLNPQVKSDSTRRLNIDTSKDTKRVAKHSPPTPIKGESVSDSNSAQPSCSPDQTQADATAKGRTADAVIKNPTPNCAPPLPELENNKSKLNRMFKRRDTTRWSAKELQALEITLGTTDEEWDALLAYYAHAGKEGYFCRNNLITCLNNWAGEIDKARRGKQAVYPKGNESSPSAPKHTPSGHKLSGREEEFWAWLKAWRPYEKRCDIRSVREDYVYDFLNGVVHEPEEPVTEIKLPRVEDDLF
jgi:hypothetical protein